MKELYKLIGKFNTLESYLLVPDKENPVIDLIDKLTFMNPSPELRKFILLNEVSKNDKVTQNELSKKINVVPAMINKYIAYFRKKRLIKIKGTNRRNTKYYLTKTGEHQKDDYLLSYMREILILYKELKEEVKVKLYNLAALSNLKVILYGAGEITELIIQCMKELKLHLAGIIDSDKEKTGILINNHKIETPEKLDVLDYNIILITSIDRGSEIYRNIRHLEEKGKKIMFFTQL